MWCSGGDENIPAHTEHPEESRCPRECHGEPSYGKCLVSEGELDAVVLQGFVQRADQDGEEDGRCEDRSDVEERGDEAATVLVDVLAGWICRTDLRIQVRRLPHRLKMARMPTTMVARVVQKEIWYAIHICNMVSAGLWKTWRESYRQRNGCRNICFFTTGARSREPSNCILCNAGLNKEHSEIEDTILQPAGPACKRYAPHKSCYLPTSRPSCTHPKPFYHCPQESHLHNCQCYPLHC